MGLIKEFKDFALKGNVVDMAVGVIIGVAFGKIVDSLVNKVMMPPIGYLTGGIDFKDRSFTLLEKGTAGAVNSVVIGWGDFVNTVIQFVIVAACLFLVIKGMNTLKKTTPPPPAPPTPTENLLGEIRDLLKAKKV